jgi:hypothetical protein
MLSFSGSLKEARASLTGQPKELAWFVRKGDVPVPNYPEPLIAGAVHKRGGSHGGARTWKLRSLTLVEHTLYYGSMDASEVRVESSMRSSNGEWCSVAKGLIHLQGLAVRVASIEEAGREHSICIYDRFGDGTACFYVQPSNADSQARWLNALRHATQATPASIALLDEKEARERCSRFSLGVRPARVEPAISC